MEQAQAATLRLADRLEVRASTLLALHRSDRLTLGEFRTGVALDVARTNTAVVQLSDVAVAQEATRQRGERVRPLGLRPTAEQIDHDRIRADVDRILAERPAVDDLAASQEARLRRLARSEPLLTAAATVHTAMERHGATGWTRLVDRDPCPVCRGWADGVTRAATVRMARHLGCGCIQQPVF